MSETLSSGKKRRACDECRSRKLACSKGSNGCERCIRENTHCHYSEQKPMGRPRKRQFIETSRDDSVTEGPMPDLDTLPFFADYNNEDYDGNFSEPYFTVAPTSENIAAELPQNMIADDGQVWHHGQSEDMTRPSILFGQVDFGNIDFHASAAGTDMVSATPTPQLSTGSNPSVTDSGSPSPLPPCSCLASMYLALASLQNFPSDIKSALYIVRSAADTAQRSIWCPQCGSVVLSDNSPPIESFQNTMLLGTILPVIANGYGRVLKMVDDETNAAIAAGQKKVFQLYDYGGLKCGGKGKETLICEPGRDPFENMEMEPVVWRTSVRALLRIDVYGSDQDGIKHKGLKDIVTEMEERQRTRHHILDAHIANGTVEQMYPESWQGHFTAGSSQQLCLGEINQPPGCLEILKIAKFAIDSLTIA